MKLIASFITIETYSNENNNKFQVFCIAKISRRWAIFMLNSLQSAVSVQIEPSIEG